MKGKKIVVIGSSNTDMVVKSSHLPAPGETVLGGQFTMNAGGKGANQAVATAKLGGDVTFIAKVGNDLFGEQAITNFNSYGIDTQFVHRHETLSSGIALIMVDDQGENSISVALGANDALSPADIEPAQSYLQNSEFVLTQLESPLDLINQLAVWSTSLDFKLVLNPAPAQHLNDEVLQSLHIITPNSVEAELLSGINVHDESSARKAATIIKSKGVNIVIITLGALGAFVLSDHLDQLIPSPKVEVVDTTAAGDTFNGALLVALSEGKTLTDAILFANHAAALSVGILGAQTSIPTRQQVDATIKLN